MKFLLRIAGLLVILIACCYFNSNNAFSQADCSYMLSPCNGDTWHVERIGFMTPGCPDPCVVTFWYRRCLVGSNYSNYVKIIDIEVPDECVAGADWNQILVDALQKVMNWYGSTFRGVLYANQNINLSMPACWTATPDDYDPCVPSYYCCFKYMLNTSSIGYKVIGYNLMSSPGTCDGPNCELRCGVVGSFPFNTILGTAGDVCSSAGCTVWSNSQEVIEFDIEPGTTLRVWYRWRQCDGTSEIMIDQMDKIDLGGGNWGVYTNQTLYNLALRKVLHVINSKFGNPITSLNLRIPKCWKETSYVLSDIGILTACGGECCIINYTDINYDNLPLITVGDMYEVYLSPVICPDVGCTIDMCDPDAYSVPLGVLFRTNTEPYKGPVRIPRDNFSSTTTYTMPNPANEVTSIILHSSINGKAVLSVFDASGNELEKQIEQKGKFETIYQIDVSKYINGLYSYRITIDNSIVASGKFVVYK